MAAPPLGVVMSHVSPHGFTASSAFHIVRTLELNNSSVTNNVTAEIDIFNSKTDYDNDKDPIDSIQFIFTHTRNTARATQGDILSQCYTALKASSTAGGRVDYARGSPVDQTDSR